MADRTISYLDPLERAYTSMKAGLFRPFRPEAWFVVGFAAWIAWLGQRATDGGLAWKDRNNPGLLYEHAMHSLREFLRNPWVISAIVLVVGAALAAWVILAWLSSRGKFVFLHDILRGKTEIVAPWKAYAAEAWSLFWWRLVFAGAVLLLLVPFGTAWWLTLISPLVTGTVRHVGLFALTMLLWIPFAVVIAFTLCFLEHFVVPIMLARRVTATAAWKAFLALFRGSPVAFIAYGLLVLVFWIVVGIAAVLFGLALCCVGWVLLATPYLGTVILLPAYWIHRAWGPEFLAQFGSEWDFRPAPEPAPPPA